MKLEKFKKDYEGLTPEERLLFHEEYGLTFKSLLDRVRDGFERLSDDDRVEFTEWEDDNYHAPCGQRLPEDEDDHDCPVDDEDDDEGDDEGDEDDDDEDDEDDFDDEEDAPDSEGSSPKVAPPLKDLKITPASKDAPRSQDGKNDGDEDSDDEDFGEGFDESDPS